MSFGIIRMQKFNRNAVRGIQIHDNREKNSISNPDIKPGEKENNYNLIDNSNYLEKIDENIKSLNLKKAVRKDAVVMCQLLITSDTDFFGRISESEQKAYFKDSLEFVQKRYGADNIISATVHKDEKTPHLHINFTPIKEGKLSAKSIFDKKELQNLQTDFFNEVGKYYNLERGKSSLEKRKHLATEEFKLETKRQELAKKGEVLEKNQYLIEPDEVERKGSLLQKEPLSAVAERLNKSFIKPLYAKILELSTALKKANSKTLEVEKELDTEKKAHYQTSRRLDETLQTYKPIERLRPGQKQEVFKLADTFTIQNNKEEEKQRQEYQEQLERERQLQEERRKEQEQAKLLEQKQVKPGITPKVEKPRKEISRGGFSR